MTDTEEESQDRPGREQGDSFTSADDPLQQIEEIEKA
jgi:hypothetical protein